MKKQGCWHRDPSACKCALEAKLALLAAENEALKRVVEAGLELYRAGRFVGAETYFTELSDALSALEEWIDTLEGHIVCPGDWIITGVKGERYPCKPDIFKMTYEPVEAAEARPEAR